MTNSQFIDWIEQAGSHHEVKISAREGNEWIERNSLIKNVDEIEVTANPAIETRYYLRIEDGLKRIEDWTHYTFPVVESNGTADGMELVVELPRTVDEEAVPWTDQETITVPTPILDVVERDYLSPVAADRVAGLDDEKERLLRFLDSTNADWGLADETGIILEGPPGTGKTELVLEVCQERYGSMPVMISGPEIISKWVGESERMLRKKFEEARNTEREQPVLYIDELDAIARTRSESSEEYSAQIVAQLLVLLDGVGAKQERERGNPLKVIASTNLSHVVDPALRRPGRLGSRPIQFERPDKVEREAILHHYLEQVRRSDAGRLGDALYDHVTGSREAVLDEVVAETEGFTGAVLEDLIQEAVTQLQEQGGTVLELSFLTTVLEEDFEPAEEIRSEAFDRTELQPSDEVDVTPESLVFELDNQSLTGRNVAEEYFYKLDTAREFSHDIRFKYREVAPADILEDDPVRAKENVIESFQHAENERICLYIRDTEELAQASEQSSLINALIGTINEQILQWNRENLVILDSVPDRYNQITNVGDD